MGEEEYEYEYWCMIFPIRLVFLLFFDVFDLVWFPSFVCPGIGLESWAYLYLFTITMITVFGLGLVISFGVAFLCD